MWTTLLGTSPLPGRNHRLTNLVWPTARGQSSRNVGTARHLDLAPRRRITARRRHGRVQCPRSAGGL